MNVCGLNCMGVNIQEFKLGLGMNRRGRKKIRGELVTTGHLESKKIYPGLM